MGRSRPKVIINTAISIDGKIATKKGESNLSSKQDKIRIHTLRSKVDAILVGINTVKRDNPLLNIRYARGKSPLRIVLDSNASINLNSKIVRTSSILPTIIAVSKKAPKKKIDKLKTKSVEIIITGKDKVNINHLLKKLSKKNISTLLVEGGGTVNWEFIKYGLVDEIITTITPYVIGGKNAVSLIEGEGFPTIRKSKKFHLYKIDRQNNEIVLHYN